MPCNERWLSRTGAECRVRGPLGGILLRIRCSADRIPPVKPGDPVRISASTFVDYLRCPASADARLHRVFGPDTRASFSGGLAHRVFARHLGQGSIDPDGFHQACREEIGSSSLNMKMAGLGLGKPSMLAPLIDEVQALYQRFRSVPVEGFVGAEVELAAEPADGVSLVGKVDAVFGDDRGSRLVDWKTGELGEPLVQLQFYGLLWALQEERASRSPGGGVCADGGTFFHRAIAGRAGESGAAGGRDGDLSQDGMGLGRRARGVRRTMVSVLPVARGLR